jgi:hypothetical protein
MTTEYKLNTYIEWTDEDRAKGECPVPKGSDVTLWLSDLALERGTASSFNWGNCFDYITAYLIHSVPREPIVRWLVVGGSSDGYCYHKERYAKNVVANHGGRVVKMLEEME